MALVCTEYILVHTALVPDCTRYTLSMYYVCTCNTFFLFSEPSFTGFVKVQRDASMLVPDAQQPPANLDIDRDDPCPEDEDFFDRPYA